MQLKFGDGKKLKYYEEEERKLLIESICNTSVSRTIVNKIAKDYCDHLATTHGTPENYVGYHPDVIDAIKKSFPNLINDSVEEAFTRKKRQKAMKILDSLIQDPKTSPQMLKLYLDLLKGEDGGGSDLTLNASLIFGDVGTKTKTEEKADATE